MKIRTSLLIMAVAASLGASADEGTPPSAKDTLVSWGADGDDVSKATRSLRTYDFAGRMDSDMVPLEFFDGWISLKNICETLTVGENAETFKETYARMLTERTIGNDTVTPGTRRIIEALKKQEAENSGGCPESFDELVSVIKELDADLVRTLEEEQAAADQAEADKAAEEAAEAEQNRLDEAEARRLQARDEGRDSALLRHTYSQGDAPANQTGNTVDQEEIERRMGERRGLIGEHTDQIQGIRSGDAARANIDYTTVDNSVALNTTVMQFKRFAGTYSIMKIFAGFVKSRPEAERDALWHSANITYGDLKDSTGKHVISKVLDAMSKMENNAIDCTKLFTKASFGPDVNNIRSYLKPIDRYNGCPRTIVRPSQSGGDSYECQVVDENDNFLFLPSSVLLSGPDEPRPNEAGDGRTITPRDVRICVWQDKIPASASNGAEALTLYDLPATCQGITMVNVMGTNDPSRFNDTRSGASLRDQTDYKIKYCVGHMDKVPGVAANRLRGQINNLERENREAQEMLDEADRAVERDFAANADGRTTGRCPDAVYAKATKTGTVSFTYSSEPRSATWTYYLYDDNTADINNFKNHCNACAGSFQQSLDSLTAANEAGTVYQDDLIGKNTQPARGVRGRETKNWHDLARKAEDRDLYSLPNINIVNASKTPIRKDHSMQLICRPPANARQ
ncbi:MAG: hypothetical protein LBT92_02350 [Rickettsiales bacterium]|nr:hypothetical protein [Rickettsiales bacterium]